MEISPKPTEIEEVGVSAGQPSRAPLTTSRDEMLRDGDDAVFRAFVHDLLAFGSRLRDIRDGLASLIGLSGPAYTILISIAHLADGGEVSVSSLARHLNVSQPFVTSEIGKLVGTGLVDKSPSELDGRSVSLTVTGAGRRLLADLAPEQREINDLLFASLSAADFDAAIGMVTTLVRDADRALDLAHRRLADLDDDTLVA